MDVTIRGSDAADHDALLRVHREAFGADEGPVIEELVTALLGDPTAEPCLSLVAVEAGLVIGHLLFTHAGMEGVARDCRASLLAPLAVVPAMQRRGVGGKLIDEGARRLTGQGGDLIFVLGHPGYYPRYGFTPAMPHGFTAPYAIPPKHADAWMVRPLRPGALDHCGGRVTCADALDRPEYWRE